MPALRRGGRALSLSPKQRTLYFGVHAAVVAARLLRCFSNKGYKLSLHPVAAALAEPAAFAAALAEPVAFAAALSVTGFCAPLVGAGILRCISNQTYIKPDDLVGHMRQPTRSFSVLASLFGLR